MRPSVLLLPWCLLSTAIASPSADGETAPETLVAGPGDEIRFVAETAEDGGPGIEAAFGGGVLRPVPGRVTAPAAGDHWLAMASRDPAGNLSPVRWILVRVDGEPPELELRTSPAAVEGKTGRWWLPPGAEVVASATDALAGVASLELEVGGERREVDEDRLAMPLPGDGEVRVRARGTDRVDNRGESSVLELSIDAEPPSVAVRIFGPQVPGAGGGLEGAVLAPSSRIEAAVTDGGSGAGDWTPELDGEASAWQAPWSAGAHTAGGEAVDRVGNATRVGPFGFVVDGEGPEIGWRVVSDGRVDDRGETWYPTPVEVTASAEDRPAGVETLQASVDGTTWDAFSGTRSIDGDRLLFRSTDRVGNVAEVEARWNLDRQGPRLEVVPPDRTPVAPGGELTVRQGDELELRVTDDGVGVDHGFYSYHLGWPFPDLRPVPERIVCRRTGRFLLHLRAVDRLGNEARGDWVVRVRREIAEAGKEVR